MMDLLCHVFLLMVVTCFIGAPKSAFFLHALHLTNGTIDLSNIMITNEMNLQPGLGIKKNEIKSSECPSNISRLSGTLTDTSVKDGTVALYNSASATWTFYLKLPVRRKIKEDESSPQAVLFQTKLKLVSDEDWRFVHNRTERLLETNPYPLLEKDYQVNVSAQIDNAYSGNYSLEIQECDVEIPHEVDCQAPVQEIFLCRVETRLNVIDVRQMNISISMTPGQHGANLEFDVDYKNKSDNFLPFKEFLVIFHSTKIMTKIRTPWNMIEIHSNCSKFNDSGNNCSDLVKKNKTVCCLDLPEGSCKISVIPIDSRCNIISLDPDLEPILATEDSRTDICRRHIFLNFPLTPIKESHDNLRDVRTGTSSIMIPAIIGGIIFVFLCLLLYAKIKKLGPFKEFLPPSKDWEALKPLTSYSSSISRVLLVYEMNDMQRERASSLRNQLLAAGVTKVYDYGDHDQEEEVNIEGIHNW